MFGSEKILLWRWCTFDAIWVFDMFFFFWLLFFWLTTNISSIENIIKNKERGRFTLYLCPNTSSTSTSKGPKKEIIYHPLEFPVPKASQSYSQIRDISSRRWNLEVVLFCKSVCGCFLYNASPSLTWMKWIFTYFHLHGTNVSLLSVGFRFRGRYLLLWCIFIFSLLVIIAQVVFLILCALEDGKWSIADAWLAKLIGLMK